MCGGLRGVSGRARAQEDPDREQTLLRAVLNEIPDPIFVKDPEGRMLLANSAALKLIGKPAEDVLGKTASEYLDDPQLGLELLKNDHRVLESGAAVSAEQVLPGPAGPRVFLTSKSPYRDYKGNLIGVIGVCRDITERKAAKAAAENSERLALMFEATSGGFWDWNIQSGGANFSPQCCEMLGYTPDEFARDYKTWKDLVHPNDLKRLKQNQSDHFAGRADFSIELRIKEKSGNWHWIHSRGLLLDRDAEGRPLRMVGTHSDIQPRKRAEEERKRLQAQLAHAQKMECVGRLAGGIAHDFGNLMSVVLLQADAALEGLTGNDAVSESVTTIQESAQKAVALTRQLLAFAKKHEGKAELLDLNSALTGCEKLVRPLIGEDIDLVIRHGQGLPLVEVDPGQIYQIVMNFAVNARDAMPHGGTLTIETAAVNETAAASIPDAKPGPYVSLIVTDNGVGMDGETKSRAFEPFFTTKDVGKGTGLGLSIVHGIVKDTGAHITLDSEPGHGTEFRVYFPAAFASPSPVAQATPAPVFRGSETILLVEDEESLRNTLDKILRRAGYRVLAAADGDQAIEMDLQTGPPAQMLLTDIVMPGLSGPELAQYLLGLHPDIKVLYMSGYPAGSGGIPLLSRDSFMQKPFTAERLLRRVRDVFDGCVSASVRGISHSSGGV